MDKLIEYLEDERGRDIVRVLLEMQRAGVITPAEIRVIIGI